MSDPLPSYVQERHAKACSLDLSSWLRDNPPPAICEPKYEGLRVFFFKSGDHLVISGKIGNIYTPAVNPVVFSKIPELVHAPRRFILDGEYVSKEGLHLFDVLQIEDRDIRPLPLYRRKEILHELIADSGLETPTCWADTEEEITKYAGESIGKEISDGILVKNPNSYYGEPNSWVRIKRFDTVDCFVIDLDTSGNSKKSWSIAVYDPAGKIVRLGEVGSYTDQVDPQKIRLGSIVEVRFSLVDNKFNATFVQKLRRDKLASECTISQIPQLEKELLP